MPSDQAPTAPSRHHDVPAGGGHPPVLQAQSAAPPRRRAAALRRFARHYAEMVGAMFVGMIVLGPVESLLFDALGWSAVTDRPDVAAVAMTANMVLAMAGWMRVRGHTWAPITEMSVAMAAPFLVLLVPLWRGAITEHTLMIAGHVLMLLGMLVAMLLRPAEYTGHHCR